MTEHRDSASEPGRWKVLDSKYLIRRWWMNLRVDRIRMRTGIEIDEFHVLEYPDWACIICRTEGDRIVMVEQYRHGVGRVIRELPAGVVGVGEDPLVAAKRELLEETGFEAANWTYLGKFSPEPSRHTNWAHFFFADHGNKVSSPELDRSEDIREVEVPIAELMALVDDGALVHGVQLSALLLAERRGLFR